MANKEYEIDVGSPLGTVAWRQSGTGNTGYEILLFTERGAIPVRGLDRLGQRSDVLVGRPIDVQGHAAAELTSQSGAPDWQTVSASACHGGGDVYLGAAHALWRLDSSNRIHLIAGAVGTSAAARGAQAREDGPGQHATFVGAITCMEHGSGGRLYVLDAGKLRVVQLPAAGSSDAFAASVVTADLRLEGNIVALACSRAAGVLYLATSTLVYKVPEAELMHATPPLMGVAGDFREGRRRGYEDAPVLETKLEDVRGLAVTREGRLLICDARMAGDDFISCTIYTLAPSRTGTERLAGEKYDTDHCSLLCLLPHGGVAACARSRLRLLPLDCKPQLSPGAQPLCPLLGSARLAADLASLRSRPSVPPDVTVLAGGRTFPAHRVILAARCEYFARLFAGGFSDSGSAELHLPDADPDAFEQLLSYMYGGELRPAPCLLRPLAELADLLLLSEASAHLQRQLVAGTCPGCVVDDLLWAEARGMREALAGLKAYYVDVGGQLAEEAPEAVERLMAASPKLHLELHAALAKRARRR